MTDESETGWNLILEGAETLAKIGKLQEHNNSTGLAVDYDPVDKSGTSRRTVRLHDSQIEWGDMLVDTEFAQSREMLYSACIAFAQHNEMEFRKFIIRCEVNGYASLSESSDTNESDTENTSESPADNKNDEIEPREHQTRTDEAQLSADSTPRRDQDSEW